MPSKKKRVFIIIAAVVLVCYCFCSSMIWLDNNDEIMQYVARHCDVNGKEIIDGEFIVSTGNTERKGTKLYRVYAEDGESRLVRVKVVYRNKLVMIGPEVRITGIELLE